MERIWRWSATLLALGGWAPLAVFVAHVVMDRGLGVYDAWPGADAPMHVVGGFALAYFFSQCAGALPRQGALPGWYGVVELTLVGTLTVTAAVFWEFAEFAADRVIGTNLQISLANTMKDLAMGVVGTALLVIVRAGRR